jgi:hypothetical protein
MTDSSKALSACFLITLLAVVSFMPFSAASEEDMKIELPILEFKTLIDEGTIGSYTGTIHHVGGSGGHNHTTIQQGVDAASDGDIVLLHDQKSYNELVTVTKEIWIMGNGSRISPPISILPTGFTLLANNVTITGFMMSYFNRAVFSTGFGHNITGNVFFDNVGDIEIRSDNQDIHSSWTSEGITIVNNSFDRLDGGLCIDISLGLLFDGENSTVSDSGDMVFQNNDFRSTSTAGTFIYIQTGFSGLNGGILDVGDIIVKKNNMTGAAQGFFFFSVLGDITNTSVNVGSLMITGNVLEDFRSMGIAMDYYDINGLFGSSRVIFDDMNISDNLLISDEMAGGILISDYALWSQLEDSSYFRSGNLTFFNNTLDLFGEGIVADLAIIGNHLIENATAITQQTRIIRNRILNSSSGIRTHIGGGSTLKDESLCRLDEIIISENHVNSTNKGVNVNFYGLGYDLEGNSSIRVEGVTITENHVKTNMTLGSSSGVEFNLQQSVNILDDNSTVHIGEIDISENVIQGYLGTLLGRLSNVGMNLRGDSIFDFDGVTVKGNDINSKRSGIQNNNMDSIGRGMMDRSSMNFGGVSYRDNTINSNGYGIFIDSIQQLGCYLEGSSAFHMETIEISGNTIDSQGDGIYLNSIYFVVSQLRDTSTSTINNVRVHENIITSDGDGITFYRFYFIGISITGDAVSRFNNITITENHIESAGNGISILYLENFGYNLNIRGSFRMDSILILNNTIISGSMGVYINTLIHFGIELYSNSTFHMNDILINGNHINSTGVGIMTYYLGNFGIILTDSAVFQMDSFSISKNILQTESRGIVLDRIYEVGSYLTDRSTFTMGDIRINENRIDSEGTAISSGSIGSLGTNMLQNPFCQYGRIESAGNMIRTNSTGILFEFIHEVGFDLQGASTFTMEGIFIEDNSVISQDSGVVIEIMKDIGSDMEEGSFSRIMNISLSDNDVDAGGKGVGIEIMRNCLSILSGSANSSIGIITMIRNRIISDGQGLFLNEMDEMAIYSDGNSRAVIGSIVMGENSIRSNGTAIDSSGHQGLGKHMSGSSSIMIGPWMVTENNIYSTNSAINILFSSIGDQMTKGNIHFGNLKLMNNTIDTGTGMRVNYETSILTGSCVISTDGVEISGNSIQRISDGDMIEIDLYTDSRDNSSVEFGKTIIRNNDRISSNISGIHIIHDFRTGGGGIIKTGETHIISNNITDCDTGIELESVTDATAYLNNFVGNGIDLDLGSTSMTWISPDPLWYKYGLRNFSSRLGNHWDTYAGPDQDDNGIGDNPFNTGYGSDTRPITNGTWEIFPPWNDITPPVITITSPANGTMTDEINLTLRWEVEDDLQGVEFQWVKLDNGPWIDVGLDLFHGFSLLTEGHHTFHVKASDFAGNTQEVSIVVLVDLTDPETAFTSPVTGSAFNRTYVDFEWSGTDELSGISGYEIAIGNGTYMDVGNDTSATLTGLTEGMHHIHLRATDNAGNRVSTMITIYIDLTRPVIEIIHPVQSMIITYSRINSSWRGDGGLTEMDSYRISLDGGNFSVADDVTYKVITELSPGIHTLKVMGFDSAGNRNSTSVTFTVDLDSPGVMILEPADGSYVNRTTITGRWRINGLIHEMDVVEFRIDGGEWNAATGTEAVLEDLSEGEHTLDVRSRDIKGNTASNVSVFTVDITNPSVLALSHEGTGAVASGPVSISFSEAVGSAEITINGEDVVVSIEGDEITINDIELLPGTTYLVGIIAQDLAGNRYNGTITFETASRGIVSGRIVDQDGNPVSGGKVVFDTGEEAEFEKDGTFSTEVTHGSRTAKVLDSDGNEIGSFEVEVTAGETDNLENVIVDPKSDEEDSKLWILVVAVVAIVLVIVAVVAFVLISKGKETEEDELEDDDYWEDDEKDELDDDDWDDDEF